MSGFKVNFSVNNQLATPSIHAAPFAQRPAAGQPGRVFIDSDNPSTGIYRDTGTTWVAIGNPSTPDVDTLQIVTDRGNTTTNSITVGAATTPSGTVDVRRSTAALNGTNDWAFIGVNTPTIPSGASFGVNYVNAVYGSQAQTFAGNATIGNTGLNSAGNFINTLGNSASGTITVAQGSGTIRAIAGLHAGIYYNTPNAMTFTHVAGIRILQPINSGAVGASVTNYYGVQIADSTPSSGTISYTNRYGIYQEGASDINYFAGNVGINTTSVSSLGSNIPTLDIVGRSDAFTGGIYLRSSANAVRGYIYGTSSVFTLGSETSLPLTFQTAATERARIFANGNCAIGTSTDGGQKFQVSGTSLFTSTMNVNLPFTPSVTAAVNFGSSSLNYGTIGINMNMGSSSYNYGTSFTINRDYTNTGTQVTLTAIDITNNWTGRDWDALSAGNVYGIKISQSTANMPIYGGRFDVTLTKNNPSQIAYGVYASANITGTGNAYSFYGAAGTLYNSGSVGIGTTTPSAKLHLNGTLRIDGQSSGTAGGSSGQHLIINLDGTTYKIALLNP